MKELSRASYFSTETLVALSTPVGGAIAIVRASGSKALSALAQLSEKEAAFFSPRIARRIKIKTKNGAILDDALAVFYKAPESYTGEDLVEYQIHGSDLIATRLIEELCSLGHRQAMPGEFSFRAVKNGKLSLSQAEAVAEVIGAKSDEALSLALEKLSGTQQNLVSEVGERLETLLVLTEAGIDFSDQDLDETAIKKLKTEAAEIKSKLSRLADSYERGRRLREGMRVSIVGRPNAGKSSFFNALLGESRAIVSEEAGTTRDVIRESILLTSKEGSAAIVVADTAGIRNSENRIESIGVENAKKEHRQSDLVLLLIEPRSSISEIREVVDQLELREMQLMPILTKVDLLNSGDRSLEVEKLSKSFGFSRWFMTSAQSGEGFDLVADEIVRFAREKTQRSQGEVLLTRIEHFRAASSAIEALSRAERADSHELLAADLRQALDAVSPLIGRRVPDDILGKIFSTFCIGK